MKASEHVAPDDCKQYTQKFITDLSIVSRSCELRNDRNWQTTADQTGDGLIRNEADTGRPGTEITIISAFC